MVCSFKCLYILSRAWNWELHLPKRNRGRTYSNIFYFTLLFVYVGWFDLLYKVGWVCTRALHEHGMTWHNTTRLRRAKLGRCFGVRSADMVRAQTGTVQAQPGYEKKMHALDFKAQLKYKQWNCKYSITSETIVEQGKGKGIAFRWFCDSFY